jgi:hypothetical protein
MPLDPERNRDSEGSRFFALFLQHWNAGTGLAVHDKKAMEHEGHWSARTFANAMEWAGAGGADPGTIQSWLIGDRWPQRMRKDAILKVFFRVPKGVGPDPQIERLRAEMDGAWQEGQVGRSRTQFLTRREEPDVAAIWIGADNPFDTAGVASLTLDPPQQGNEPNAPWYVRARLWLDVGEYEAEDGKRFYLGLRRAFISLAAAGFRVVNRSLIGDKARPHPNFEGRSNGVDVIGPRLVENGCLSGDPLGEDYIAQIWPADDGTGQATVTVSLHAFRSDFAFILPASHDTEESEVASLEKDRVLNVLISKNRRDEQGRVLVARDTMKRR